MRTHTTLNVAAILLATTLTSACGGESPTQPSTPFTKTVYVCADGSRLETDSCPPSNPLVEQVLVTEYVCADGSTKASAEECPPVEPVVITETVVETVTETITERIYVCADGSEADTAEECPPVPPETVTVEVTVYVCQDGQRLSTDDCPDIAPVVEVHTETVTRYVCALNSAVVEDPTTCPQWRLVCPQGTTVFSDTVTGEQGCRTIPTGTLDAGITGPPRYMTYVRGSQNVVVSYLALTASNEPVIISSLTYQIIGSNTLRYTSCSVYDEMGYLVDGPEYSPDGRLTFSGFSWRVTPGSNTRALFRCNFANEVLATDETYGARLEAVTAMGASTGNTINVTGTPAGYGSVITIVNQGALTARLAGDSPSSTILLGGTTRVVAKYRLSATTEAQRVQRVNILAAYETAPIVAFQLQSGNATWTSTIINGTAQFLFTDILVPRDDFTDLTITAILADVTTENGFSGAEFQVVLTGLGTIGVVTGASQDLGITVPANLMKVRKTKPTVSLASGSPSGAAIPGLSEVLRFNVSADSRGYVGVRSFTFQVSATDNSFPQTGWRERNAGTWKLYDASDMSTPIPASLTFGTSTFPWTSFVTVAPLGQEVGAGTTKTYILKFDSTGASAANDDSIRVDVIDIGWSDAGLANADGWRVQNLQVTGGTMVF